jgi:hypothetical protein
MQNRKNNIQKIRENLYSIGLTDQIIDDLFKLFDDLERKLWVDSPGTSDVEVLVEGIYDLTTEISVDNIAALWSQIQEIAKNYTSLLTLLINVYKGVIQSQIKYADLDSFKDQIQNSRKFTRYLKDTFIAPMIFKLADISPHSYVSSYFGEITIFNNEHEIINKLANFNIDAYLNKLVTTFKKNKGSLSAIQPDIIKRTC